MFVEVEVDKMDGQHGASVESVVRPKSNPEYGKPSAFVANFVTNLIVDPRTAQSKLQMSKLAFHCRNAPIAQGGTALRREGGKVRHFPSRPVVTPEHAICHRGVDIPIETAIDPGNARGLSVWRQNLLALHRCNLEDGDIGLVRTNPDVKKTITGAHNISGIF